MLLIAHAHGRRAPRRPARRRPPLRRRLPLRGARRTLAASAFATAVGLALDRLAGEPPAPVHPVAAFGRLMGGVERCTYRDARGRGVLHAAIGVGVGAAAGTVAAGAGGAGVTAAVAMATAGRMLGESARRIGDALEGGDLAGARAALPTLVGRDPSGLDAGEVARAVVESVAENTVDAVVAPAFWAVVGGAPGVLAHRAVNTLDAMVGHRSPRYERFGWASARLDDVAAWLPARLTAALVAVARPRRAGAVWRAVRDQAPEHPSPNAGVAEAAFAAALGVRLGGRNRYDRRVEERALLGRGGPPQPADVARAVDLLDDVTAALAAALVVVAVVSRSGRGGPRPRRTAWRLRASRPSGSWPGRAGTR
jgi:adenosylcobinamide-phosphate synthase